MLTHFTWSFNSWNVQWPKILHRIKSLGKSKKKKLSHYTVHSQKTNKLHYHYWARSKKHFSQIKLHYHYWARSKRHFGQNKLQYCYWVHTKKHFGQNKLQHCYWAHTKRHYSTFRTKQATILLLSSLPKHTSNFRLPILCKQMHST